MDRKSKAEFINIKIKVLMMVTQCVYENSRHISLGTIEGRLQNNLPGGSYSYIWRWHHPLNLPKKYALH